MPFFIFGAKAKEFEDEISAENAILYNVETKRTVYKKNPDETIYPGPTAKMMTAVLALEYYADKLDKVITVRAEMIKNVSGNNISLSAGESFSAEQYISALIVGNSNDAAMVLVCDIAGSEEKFVELMNRKAKEIGMENTVYKNATGMHDDGMVTTAADTLKLAEYAFMTPRYIDIASLPKYQMGKGENKRTIHNRNYLVSKTLTEDFYYGGAHGMNVGSTYEAKASLVTSVTHEGLNYLLVLMGCDYNDKKGIGSYADAQKLLDFVKNNYGYIRIVDRKDMVNEIKVLRGKDADYVSAVPSCDCDVLLPKDISIKDEVKYTFDLPNEINAPVVAGDKVGQVIAEYNGEIIATCDIIVKNSVDENAALALWSAFTDFAKTPTFWLIVAVVLFVIIYVVGAVIYARRRRMHSLHDMPTYPYE